MFNCKEMNPQKAVNYNYPETTQTYLSLELPITSLLPFYIISSVMDSLCISPSRKLVSCSLNLDTLDLQASLPLEQACGRLQDSFLADRHVSGCRTSPEPRATVIGRPHEYRDGHLAIRDDVRRTKATHLGAWWAKS